MPGGRPSTYTPEIAEAICERLANGETLLGICKDEGMPNRQTVSNWCVANAEFFGRYARAKLHGADVMAEQTLEIAAESSRDTYIDDDGHERTNHEVVQRSRLRVDTIKWYTAKIAPKLYGERVQVEDVTPPENRAPQFAPEIAAKLQGIAREALLKESGA